MLSRTELAHPVMGTIFLVNMYGCGGLSLITVPIHEGETRVRGQLAYDNPDVATV